MENAHEIQVSTSQWLSLKPETKVKLREIFFVPRSSVTEVVTDNFGKSMVMSDGTTHKDLTAINVERMRDYLGQELTTIDETFNSLFEKVVKRIETPVVVEMVTPVVVVAEPVIPVVEITPVAPVIEQKLEEPKVDQPRTIECPICKKIIKCKDAKFDARIMKMHINRWHPANKI